jgi:hypothetical protein
MRSTKPADWLENTGHGTKWVFFRAGPKFLVSEKKHVLILSASSALKEKL